MIYYKELVASHERKVFERLQKAFEGTSFSVEAFPKEGHYSDDRGFVVPDIVIYDDGRPVAAIEVKNAGISFSRLDYDSQLKRYGHWLSNNYQQSIFVITDGESFALRDRGSYAHYEKPYQRRGDEVLLTFALFVSYIKGGGGPLDYRLRRDEYYEEYLLDVADEFGIDGLRVRNWLFSHGPRILFKENQYSYCFASDDIEKDFFLSLLGFPEGRELCRYTSLDSLFRLLKDKKQNMCSIVCMNDKGELSYVDSVVPRLPVMPVPDDPNNCFILSLLPADPHEDELTFWRLYGDDASGACLTYEVKPGINTDIYPDFFLARVSYQREDGRHPELEFIKTLTSRATKEGKTFTMRNWHIWKHFFKTRHFAIEDEVRLLYMNSGGKKPELDWIKNATNRIVSKMVLFTLTPRSNALFKFPLSLSKVLIGPKITESEVVNQYRYMGTTNLKKINSIGASHLTDIYR